MISSINSYSARTYARKSQQNKTAVNQQKQPDCPSFKGGTRAGLVGALSYFGIDFAAIFLSCSAEAAMFRHFDYKEAHKHGISTIRVDFPKQLKEMSTLTANISYTLQQNPKTRRLGKKLKKTYEKALGTTIEYNKENIPKGTLHDQLNSLHNKIEVVCVRMKDPKITAMIGTPVMNSTKSVRKKLKLLEAQQAKEIVKETVKAKAKRPLFTNPKNLIERTLNNLIASPNVPRSQHP